MSGSKGVRTRTFMLTLMSSLCRLVIAITALSWLQPSIKLAQLTSAKMSLYALPLISLGSATVLTALCTLTLSYHRPSFTEIPATLSWLLITPRISSCSLTCVPLTSCSSLHLQPSRPQALCLSPPRQPSSLSRRIFITSRSRSFN
jgi:hypothetical protein